MSTSTRKNKPVEAASYHHGNLREALLESGLELLEEAGEAGFSLRELARRLGVTANAAYRHYANKEVLLMGLAAEGFRLFADNQMQLWQDTPGSAADKFLASGCGYVRFACEHPALFRLMFGHQAASQRTDELAQASSRAFDGLLAGVASVLDLPPETDEARLAATNAWALVHGFSHLILDGQLTDSDVEAQVRQALTLWLGR